MSGKAIFYHAGCPVCVAAEDHVAEAIDRSRYDVEVVHLGNDKARGAVLSLSNVLSSSTPPLTTPPIGLSQLYLTLQTQIAGESAPPDRPYKQY